jgi:site-specific DNA-cytosine methylase
MAHKHKLNTFHLFSGAGGGILADLLLGHNPIGACEIEPYPRDVLLARQRDGILPAFPIWDDVCTLDGTPWRGTVDILCGGFPCQDISAAGKGAGITGERSGLWKEYARLIGEMRPRFVFAENSPLLRTRGLGVVLEDLAALGYNARWGVLGARDVGAPHKRDRMWVLAYANNNGNSPTKESKSIAQGSNSGTPRPKQTIEPSGLCASRTNGSMEGSPEELAYAATRDTSIDSRADSARTARVGWINFRMRWLIGGSQTQQKAQLNPSWVEWLMGWPIGWTDLKPLETDKFHSVQLWHSLFSQED